jgi:GT2 family glycosyltransferase
MRPHRHRAPAPVPPAARRIWSGLVDLDGDGPPDEALLTASGAPFDDARLLVRKLGEPLGFVTLPLTDGRLDRARFVQAAERRWTTAPHERPRAAGAALPVALPAGDAGDLAAPWPTGGRATPVSVVVCTRDRPAALARCLDALRAVAHDALEIVVVDNAPTSDDTVRLVAGRQRLDGRLRYVREDRPGLSRARNRGAREATSELLAFTDDDVRVDPLWVAALVRGFHRGPDVGCVTGLVASASLELPGAQYFNARVSWSASCEQRLFGAARGPRDSRLHPYGAGAFGTGATMAFRATVLREIGGFDECLGAGSPAGGGEDLDAFVRVLLAGYRLSYEPAALAWHEHRVTQAELGRQMYAYGKGLSAYWSKHLVAPRSRRQVAARLAAATARLVFLTRRSRAAAGQAAVSRYLPVCELGGLLVGPFAYLRGRLTAERLGDAQRAREAKGPCGAKPTVPADDDLHDRPVRTVA